MNDTFLGPDAQLDAIALLKAHIDRDGEAVKVITAHGNPGAYVALLDIAESAITQLSEGSPHQFLDDVAHQVRANEENNGR